tara:strand:- start:20 stop:220 length:201 start_codon:yes stop_codon:yes gene_type:complete
MGIEARRNIKDISDNELEDKDIINDDYDDNIEKNSISQEISKLNDLKNKGLLTEEEYKRAKEKVLS